MKNIDVIIPSKLESWDFLQHALYSISDLQNINKIFVVIDSTDPRVLRSAKNFPLHPVRRNIETKFIMNRLTPGPAGARQSGLLESKCKYVALLDDDDTSSHNRYASQREYLESQEADICFTNFSTFSDNSQLGDQTLSITEHPFIEGILPNSILMLGAYPGAQSSLFANRESLLNSGGFLDSNFHEDYQSLIVNFRTLKICLLNEIHYFYRQHNSQRHKIIPKNEEIERLFSNWVDFGNYCGISRNLLVRSNFSIIFNTESNILDSDFDKLIAEILFNIINSNSGYQWTDIQVLLTRFMEIASNKINFDLIFSRFQNSLNPSLFSTIYLLHQIRNLSHDKNSFATLAHYYKEKSEILDCQIKNFENRKSIRLISLVKEILSLKWMKK